jgi:NAD(P)-dependent dehydrogenase (short-subunit alcohol dehydrogenase family)
MTTHKTVILTGGYGGIGFQAARSIVRAKNGWHVVIAGRNVSAAADAVRKLHHACGGFFKSGITRRRVKRLSALPSNFSLVSRAMVLNLEFVLYAAARINATRKNNWTERDCGCTRFAELVACMNYEDARKVLGLDANSRVIEFNSEGATSIKIPRPVSRMRYLNKHQDAQFNQ